MTEPERSGRYEKGRGSFAFWRPLLLAGCAGGGGADAQLGYTQISAQQAKEVMDQQPDAVILDVREQGEYDAGHIPGAVLLPVGSIDGGDRGGGHPHPGHHGPGLLPQRQPEQDGLGWPWPSWGTPRFMSSAASRTGPTMWRGREASPLIRPRQVSGGGSFLPNYVMEKASDREAVG